MMLDLLKITKGKIKYGTEMFWVFVRKASIRLAISGLDEELCNEIILDIFKSYIALEQAAATYGAKDERDFEEAVRNYGKD